MRAAVELGNRGLALRRYGELRHRLRTELQVDPVPETSALHQEISRVAAPVAPTDSAIPPEPSREQPLPATDRTVRELRLVRRRLTALIHRLQESARHSS
jgi:DNA-binding SARP family transcriptional activator